MDRTRNESERENTYKTAKPDGNRGRSKPKPWINGLEKDLISKEVTNWKNTAQNRGNFADNH